MQARPRIRIGRVLALPGACALALAGAWGEASSPGAEPEHPMVGLSATAGPVDRSGEVRPLSSRPGAVPRITVTSAARDTAPGLTFANARAPRPGARMGPVIFDERGRVAWFKRLPASRASVGLQPFRYRGRTVLSWGERPAMTEPQTAEGTYAVIADSRYRILKRLRVRGRDVRTDLHEFVITPRGTALMLGLRRVRHDLRRVGGSRNAVVTEGVVQEQDVRTGRVLMTWHSLRHIPVTESTIRPRPGRAFDYLHLNSIAEDSDGHLLLSARHTNSVFKIHRRTGRILWRLGGRRSSFRMGRGARFAYQHDAQRLPGGDIQLFDNAASDFDRRAKRSRVLNLRLDHRRRRATVAREYAHPDGLLAISQGNARTLPNGSVFVGWGSIEQISEFAPDGRLLWDAKLPGRGYQSYRAFKGEWTGRPPGEPAVTAARGGRAGTLVFASWNGATEVERWRVRGGPAPGRLTTLGLAWWAGLETRIEVPGRHRHVQVEALDAAGHVLGRSDVVRP